MAIPKAWASQQILNPTVGRYAALQIASALSHSVAFLLQSSPGCYKCLIDALHLMANTVNSETFFGSVGTAFVWRQGWVHRYWASSLSLFCPFSNVAFLELCDLAWQNSDRQVQIWLVKKGWRWMEWKHAETWKKTCCYGHGPSFFLSSRLDPQVVFHLTLLSMSFLSNSDNGQAGRTSDWEFAHKHNRPHTHTQVKHTLWDLWGWDAR